MWDDKLKLVRWKITTCISGEKCWCRIIEPEVEMFSDDGHELYIAGDGTLSRGAAEYLVEIHNISLANPE